MIIKSDRSKNAEIFRDAEHKYKSDSELIDIIQKSTKNKECKKWVVKILDWIGLKYCL